MVPPPRTFNKSSIKFVGKNNKLIFADDNINVENTNITFNGSDSVVVLHESTEPLKLNCNVYNNSIIWISKNMWSNGQLSLYASECKHIVIGEKCLFGRGCAIRTGDAHRIYDIETMTRTNEGKSVFLGDNVWCAEGVKVLKGSRIYSGCAAGTMSLLTGKEYFSNTIYGGNPAKAIKTNVVWDKRGTHGVTHEQQKQIRTLDEQQMSWFVYNNQPDVAVDFESLDSQLDIASVDKKVEILSKIFKNKAHNRFAKK